MQTTLGQLTDWMNAWAPWDTAEPWDNVGALVRSSEVVTGVVCCLDITAGAAAFAAEKGCNTLLSHHPVIFHPLKALAPGRPAVLAVKAELNALCAHTNLDKAPGGVCDLLARAIGLADVQPGQKFCRVGTLPAAVTAAALARQVGAALVIAVQYTRALADRPVQRVAVVSGAGGDLYDEALALGAQCLVTGEAGHHDFLDAAALGLPIIAAGHWGTERLIAPELARRVSGAFPGLPVFPYVEPAPAAWLAGPGEG